MDLQMLKIYVERDDYKNFYLTFADLVNGFRKDYKGTPDEFVIKEIPKLINLISDALGFEEFTDVESDIIFLMFETSYFRYGKYVFNANYKFRQYEDLSQKRFNLELEYYKKIQLNASIGIGILIVGVVLSFMFL